jgi:hypothetical protein
VSNAITISAAAVSKVTFIQEPTNAAAGAVISPAITVQLQDAFGNPIATSGTAVTLALSSGTGTLSGTATQSTNASGLATFSNLSINLIGSKNLTASSTGLASDISNAFTISSGSAAHVAFLQQPASTTAGVSIAPPMTVQLQDALNNPVAAAGVAVSLTLTTGTGSLAGTVTRNTDGTGLATFDDISISAAGSKNITASSAGVTSAVSSSFAISAAAASQLTFVQQPTNVTAGAAITPAVTVQVRDAFGNAVAAAGTSVTITLSSGTGALGGTATQSTNASGVATFSNLSVNLAGAKAITASSTGLASSTSAAFTVSAAAAAQLAFVQEPANASAGAAISPAATVQLRDAFGNNVATSGVAVTVALSSGTGALSGTLTRSTNASGLASFNDLSINLAGAKNLRAASAGLTPDTSAAFTISAGAASRVTILQEPTSTTANTSIAPPVTVQLVDAFGNAISSSGVVLTVSLVAGTGTLSGTLSRSTIGPGIATFDDLSINLAGSKNLRVAGTGLTADTSAAFTILAGAATKVVFVQQPTNGSAGSALSPAVTVQLQDASNNNVPSSGVSVTLALSSGTGTLSGTATRTTDAAGLATFNDLSVDLAGAKALSASSAGLASAASASFTISAGTAAQLVFIQGPTNAVAGATISPAVTVQLRDAFGNNVSSSGVAVAVSITGGSGTITGTTTQSTGATGLATFGNLSINLAGTKNLRAASTGLTPDTSSAFTISPAAASQLAFVQQPTDAVSNTAVAPAVTVQLLDPFGNTVSSSGVAVTVSLSTGTGTLSGTLTRSTNASGLATFNDLSINLTGQKTLTAASAGLGSDGSAAFTILAGAATKVVFSQQPTTTSAGAAITPAVTVQLQDASGNGVPSAGVSVTLSLTAGTGTLAGTLIRTTDATGLATFNDLSISVTGSKAITAASAGLTSAVSPSFTITPAAASKLVFVQEPTTAVAGATISPAVTVQLRDAFGNNVPTPGVSVAMSLATGTGTLSGTVAQSTDATGLAAFSNLSINLSGAKNLRSASAGLTPDTSNTFTISPGAATQIVLTQPPTNATAGTVISPAVTAQLEDALGNAVSTSGVSVSVSLSSGTGTLSGTLTKATNGGGVATFSDLSINLAGAKNLRAAAAGLTPDTSAAFTISPAAASQLVFTQQPTSTSAGSALTPAIAVQLRDPFGNNVPATGVTVTMSLSTGTGVLSGTVAQPTNASGLASFPDLSVNLAGAKNISAASAGLTSATSTAFTIFPGPATSLVFVQQPTNALPNVAISPAVTVQIQDNFGNNISALGVSINMNLTSGTGTLAGTTIRTTNASGLASFNDLSVNLTGTKNITASSAGLASATSAAFTIAAGSATTVRVETAADGTGVSVPSQSLTAGSSITVYAVTRDAAGNFVANVAANAWSLQSVTGGIAAGDLVPSADSKSAVFTGHLTGGAQIRATSPPLSTVNSGTITVAPSAATQLAFVQQPTNGVAGAFLSPAVTVQLRDVYGNSVPAAGTAVTISLSSGTGAISGTLTQPTNAQGLATFSNLSVNQPGVKALTAASTGLTSAVSASFTLSTYTITASAGANGSISPSGTVSVINGASQTFTMSPNFGYVVANILVDGASAGAGSSFTFDSVTTNHTISVSFTPATLSITVQTNPAGQAITVDGIAYTSPQVFSWTANTTHTIATDSLQAVSAGKRNAFSSWSDAGAASHAVTPLVNTTYTARFRTQFLLSMSANTGGSVTPASGYQDSAATVQITAIPAGGYSFSSWTGAGSGSVSGGVNPANVFVGSPISEAANFTLNNVLITIATAPPGRQYYVDGVSYSIATTFSFQPGSVHSLSADSLQSQTSTSRFVWTGWSDGDVRTHSFIVPSSNATYTASFKRQFFLTMNAGVGGSVTPASNWRDSASVVAVTATPLLGYSFTGWTGSGPGSYSGPLNPANITITGAVTETAGFTLFPVNVTITTVPAGRSYAVDGAPFTGTQAFVWSATAPHTLSTVSPQGDTLTRYLYAGWSDGGSQSHTVAPVSDTTYTLNFTTQHYLTVNAGTGGTAAPPSGWYAAGQSVPISATPSTGYSFTSWSGAGAGSYSGAVNASSVTMNGPVTETANFTPNNIQITVATSPAGRTITVDGVNYAAPQTFTWVANSSHTIATDSTQNGAAGTRYVWSAWSDAGTLSHVVAPLVPTTYTATFATQYFLTTSAGSGGTVSPASSWFAAGQSVPISASAGTGYTFSAWTGSGSGSYTGAANPSSVTMNGPVTESAAFTPNSIQVTVTTSPGGRAITVDGVSYTAPRTFTWTANTNHTVQADSILAGIAGTRYVYASWSDGGAMTHTVAPLVATTLTANFTTQYFLTMNTNVGGSVLPPSGWYNSAQTVSITATPTAGFGFLNWNGSGVGSYSGGNNPANVVMNGPITETANFAQYPYQVTVGTNPPGRAYRVNGTDYTTPQTFSVQPGNGLSVSIITDPQPGTAGTRYSYSSWSDSGAMAHFFIPTSDSALVATFTTQYLLTTSAGSGGTVAPPTGWHNGGTVVPIAATPNLGYSFSAWTGSGSGAYTGPNNPSSVTMGGPISEAASFTLFPVQVTLQSDPPGRSVSVDGTLYTTPQVFTFTSGTSHTLDADSIQTGSAGTRYLWTGWSDGGARAHSVTLVKDTVFTLRMKTQFLLTTIAATGGSVTPPSGWLDSAKTALITATPAGGYSFAGWTGSGPGSYTGNTNPAGVTMSGPVTDSASFTLGSVQVTVTSSPAGRTVTVDGTSYAAPQTFTWVANSSHTIQADSIQAGAAGTRYVFASWSDTGAIEHVVTPSAARTYTANFTTQYYVTMNTNTGGSVSPPSGWFNRNAAVTITATPDNGYGFISWSGAGTGSYSGGNNPATVFPSAPITETANFGQNAVLITIRTSPSGRTFTVDGTTYTSVFTFSFLPGSVHAVSSDSIQVVAGGTRYLWSAWSDSAARSHLLEIGGRDTTLTASFRTQYGLTTASAPAAAGTITPAGLTYFNVGDTATVMASPNSGYAFTSWTGSIATSANPAQVIMSAPKSATANFAAGARITLQTNPAGRSIVVDGASYTAPQSFSWLLNTSHTIGTTTPQTVGGTVRHLWTGWSDGGAISHSVTAVRDTAITASFTTQYYLLTASGPGGSVAPPEGWRNAGDTVTIAATPDTGRGFIEWQGTGTGSYTGANSSARIVMASPVTESATFGALLAAPVLAAPADRALQLPPSPVLAWRAYAGATAYILQVATDSLFAMTVYDSSTIADTAIAVPALENKTTYYWRVKAKAGAGVSTFSLVRSFSTRPKSIAAVTPAKPWVTRYVQTLSWTSVDLASPVNVLLSTNGGTSFTTLLAGIPNTGSYSWKLPDATPLGSSCKVRIVSTADATVFGETAPFAVVSGQLPLIVPLSTTVAFPDDPTATTFYRLVSAPGIVDSTKRLTDFLPGTPPADWRMFWDNGGAENYLEELTPLATLGTGRGYWLLKKKDFNFVINMAMPALDSVDASYAIALHDGWNIIGNPFDKNVSWASVLELNGLDPATPLYTYAGAFSGAATLEPFKGYYFFNEGPLPSLKFPYPFGTGAVHSSAAAGGWRVQMKLASDLNEDPDNYIGVDPAAKPGLDAKDSRKPPLFLDQGFLYFDRPEWDKTFPRFSADVRPAIGEGQIWNFEVAKKAGTKGAISFRGLDSVPAGYEVVLVNAYNTAPFDLRAHPEYTFTSVGPKMPFTLIIGTKDFVRAEVAKDLPVAFELAQNFPNPFNPTTSISVRLPHEARIRLDIYSVLGQRVATLADGTYPEGVHTFVWDGVDDHRLPVATGVYLYRLLDGDNLVQTKKMLLTK